MKYIIFCLMFLLHLGANAQSRMLISTARQASEIDTVFPYDIILVNRDSVAMRSDSLLLNSDKPVVLLFWLTTCYPCHAMMDAITKDYARWETAADFRFVAISTDYNHNFQKFRRQAAQYGWPFEIYNDSNREFCYVMPGGLNGLPQVFVIYKGEIVYHRRKYAGDEADLLQKLTELSPKG